MSSALNRAEADGVRQLESQIGEYTYTFDLEKKLQLNKHSGTSRRIRPPMRR